MKVKEMQQYMKEKEIDSCVFLYNTPNFFYFGQQEFTGAVVVPKKGAMVLVASRLDAPRGRVKVWSKGKLSDAVKQVAGGTVGIDKGSMTLKQHSGFKKEFGQGGVDVSGFVHDLRKTKTSSEINILGRACMKTEDIMKDCISRFRKFKTEMDVSNYLRTEAIERDCEPSFDPVVASGGYASIPHHKPKRVKIRTGFCVIDFGVKYRGYCADLTRTVFVGRPSRKDRSVFNATQVAQNNVLGMVRPGVETTTLYRAAKEELGKSLIHNLGHGVGIEVHEAPWLGAERREEIQEGMVFTVEPGYYSPRRIGIRLEDMVLVTKKGCRLLSKQQEFITV
jgi:Xaa-Pro aminopeptidase